MILFTSLKEDALVRRLSSPNTDGWNLAKLDRDTLVEQINRILDHNPIARTVSTARPEGESLIDTIMEICYRAHPLFN